MSETVPRPSPVVMRRGKTARDRRSGALTRRLQNKNAASSYNQQLSDANRTGKVVERPTHFNGKRNGK